MSLASTRPRPPTPGASWRQTALEHRKVAALFPDLPDVAAAAIEKALLCERRADELDGIGDECAACGQALGDDARETGDAHAVTLCGTCYRTAEDERTMSE